MDSRGQNRFPVKRRRRWWLITLAVVVVAIGGGVLYAKLSQPPMVKVLWEHRFDKDEVPVRLHMQPSGGIATVGYHSIFILDRQGEECGSIVDLSKWFSSNISGGSFVDSQGNVYVCIDSTLCSYNADGTKCWEVILPHENASQTIPMVSLNVIDYGVLVASAAGELFMYDFNGRLVFQKQSATKLVFFTCPCELPGGYAVIALPPSTNSVLRFSARKAAILDTDLNQVWDSTSYGEKVTSMMVWGDQLVFTIFGDRLYAVDETGNKLWEYNNPDPFPYQKTSHEYELFPVNERELLILSDEHAVMVDYDGKVSWEIEGAFIGVCAIESDRTQYLVQHIVSESNKKARSNINQNILPNLPRWFTKLMHTKYKYKCEIVRLDHGQITKRWSAPVDITRILGPGPDGEFYLFSSTLDDGTLYCVKLD